MPNAPAILLTAALTLAAAPAAAAEFMFAKPGATYPVLQADAAACAEEARTGRTRSGAPIYNPSVGAAANAGAALAVGVLEGMAQAKAQTAHMERCMRRSGYAKLALTPEEEVGLKAARSDEARRAWSEAFLAGGREARIEAALRPLVPALPSAEAEPFALHGLKLDPQTLTASTGLVLRGKPLMTAQARYRRTATIAKAFELGGMLNARAEQGAVFHLVETRPELDGVDSSRWCGPVTHGTVWGKRVTRAGCVHSSYDGYQWSVWPETVRPLLTQSINPPMTGVATAGALELNPTAEESATHPVELRLMGIGRKDLTVELLSLASEKPLAVWRKTLPFDAAGVAVVSLWDRQLVLTRSGKGVTASLKADGDGQAPDAPDAVAVAAAR